MKNKIKNLEKYILLNESDKIKFDSDKIKCACKKHNQLILNFKEFNV
jgi:hypothetical protein